MFNHNRKVLDKKAELLIAKADEEGRQEGSEGQNWHKHAKVYNHLEGGLCCCTSNQFMSTGSDPYIAAPIGLLVYGFRDPIHHNPVWKQMCEVKRYESIIEKIPGMELEEVNCKLTENTKVKLKDGTVTEKL